VRLRHRVRLAVNLLNGSTLAGLAVARAGGARLARFPDGLLVGTGYRLPVPPAPAFTLGNLIITRRASLDFDTPLARHEARHCTQYAWCGGVLMLPLYFAAAGVSWLVSGDVGAWNVFERGAGLTDGNYTARPLRRVPDEVLSELLGKVLGKRRAGEHPVHLTSVPVGDKPDMPD
jgi:hypothetical protein